MKFQVKEISPIKKELEVVLPAEEVAQELENAFAELQKKVALKGFRPGKVPRSFLEQNYRQDAESRTIELLIAKSFRKAIEEANLHAVDMPEVQIRSFGASEGFVYQMTVDVPPVIEVKGYTGLSLVKEKIEVVDHEVEENLKGLQERMTQLIPIPETRPARAEDIIAFDYQGFMGDRPVSGLEARDYLTELGKGHVLAPIDSALIGMAPGEKKEVDVGFPPNWNDKKIAGKTVRMRISLKEIKEKKLPELNDDFAKDLGNFQTLEEVRSKIREDLTQAKEQAAKNGLKRQAIEKLIEENKFDVPEGMVKWQLQETFHRLEASLKGQGLTLEQAGIVESDFFAKNRDEALFRVKEEILFDTIAQKENIPVTPEEVDRRIAEMARASGQSEAVWKKHLAENNRLKMIEVSIREEKTLDFVLSQSKIKTKG